MVNHSHTSIHKNLGKVRKARAVVVVLLVAVSLAILFIDKKEEKHVIDLSKQMAPSYPSLSSHEAPQAPAASPTVKPSRSEDVLVISTKPEAKDIISPLKDIGKTTQLPDDVKEKKEAKEESTAKISKKSESAKKSPNLFAEGKKGSAKHSKKSLRKSGVEEPAIADARSYLVVSGDSFWSIAKKHYQSAEWSNSLYLYNKQNFGFSGPKNSLKVGDELQLPPLSTLQNFSGKPASNKKESAKPSTRKSADTSAVATARLDNDSYIVAKGDTLHKISKKLRVDFLRLLDFNRDVLHNDANRIKEGVKLRIPR